LSFPGAALHHWPGPRDWRTTAGRALGEEIASPLVLELDLSCRDMWGGLGGAETTRGRRSVLNIQGCLGNASPKPKSGRKGSKKKKLFAKSPCRKPFPKFRQKFRCQFFLDVFVLSRFRVFFLRWEFKSTTKGVLQKKSRRKVPTKNSTKNPKPNFSRFFLITFLGVSL
jgi:hypothetical protein